MENQIAPRHLARYLVASLRNRARNRHRDANRRHATQDRAYAEPGSAHQRVVAECHSVYGLRVSDPLNLHAVHAVLGPIARLAEECKRRLSPEEMTMLVQVGRHVPLRQIADQLGISYGAARVRLHRLRERFKKIAIEHLASLKASERDELERFFRRAEVSLNGVAQHLEGSNGTN